MTAAIILAAGQSSRLGRPKQNLLFQGQTLFQRAVDAAKKSNCDEVIVVLGANSDKIDPLPGVRTLFNQDWEEGMASSIRKALEEVAKNIAISQLIIMVCDQPFVNAELLNALINRQTETNKPLIACTYNGTTGVPALFTRPFFADLLGLKGQQGAKKILTDYAEDVATVLFEKGDIDIDTPFDYEQLRKLND